MLQQVNSFPAKSVFFEPENKRKIDVQSNEHRTANFLH